MIAWNDPKILFDIQTFIYQLTHEKGFLCEAERILIYLGCLDADAMGKKISPKRSKHKNNYLPTLMHKKKSVDYALVGSYNHKSR